MSDIPELLQIETSTSCSGSCIFCPHSKISRQKGNMTPQFFEKIIKDAKEF